MLAIIEQLEITVKNMCERNGDDITEDVINAANFCGNLSTIFLSLFVSHMPTKYREKEINDYLMDIKKVTFERLITMGSLLYEEIEYSDNMEGKDLTH